MPTPSFKEILIDLLKNDARLVDEQGDLRENLVHEYANELDPQLIELLLNDSQTRERFFLKIKDVYVFKQNDFRFFLDENKLDNSYTQFENKIGLSLGSRLLRETSDVVLNFPYKDCILEGGQSTEEGSDVYFEFDVKEGDYVEKKAKRKEVFFNQILARDEIDRLLEPKAFTNIKHFTKDGEEKLNGFTRDENGTIKDNLIIKGNNLLALHSLKQEFRGKVKLIYIDPPYNTGNDSFAYNDNFNHSTWLTFMKNRLEVARELLSDTGVLIVQAHDKEQAYLKVLLDDVMKKEQFETSFFIQVRYGNKTLSEDNDFQKVMEVVHVYSKNHASFRPNKIKEEYSIDKFKFEVTEIETGEKINIGGKIVEILKEHQYSIKEVNPHINGLKETWATGSLIRQGGTAAEFLSKYLIERKSIDGLKVLYKVYGMGEDGLGYRYISGPKKEEAFRGKFYTGIPLNIKSGVESGSYQKQMPIPNFLYNFLSYEGDFGNCRHEGGVDIGGGKKPEMLISYFIEYFTKPNDIILDYHLGSGTSAATAHKMGRQYIGIEQLNYGQNDSVLRLKNVINGDKTGISKNDDINWQGEGSFIYLELAKNNQNAIDQIEKAESLETLNAFFEEMCEKYFLHYNVKIKEFRERISKEGAFIKLPLARQKEIYVKMLDLNQLYVNVSDMQDSRYALSKEDISLNNDFYKNEL